MNRNAIARLVIYSIITAILIGVLVTGLDWNGFDWDLGSADQSVTGTASVDAASIKRICIEWVDGTVDVRTAQQDTITFSETNGEKLCMVYSFKGDTLVIRYSKESLKLGINIKTLDKHLTVHVPEGWIAEDIEVTAVSANVTIDLPEARETEIETVSGDISIRYERSGEISLTTVSGQTAFEGSCDDLDCNSVSGDYNITLSGSAKEINMESISGDLEIVLDSQSGFTAQLDSVSGHIRSTFPTNVSGNTHTYGDGSMRIEAETVSGNIQIKEVASFSIAD